MNEAQASTARGDGEWFRPGRFALMLAVMVMVPFWDVLSGQKTFAVRDFGLFSFPVANYFRESFWRGEWPLWNPLSCLGTPFLAQLNTLTLYPPSLIYLLLPLPWALPFFCLLHLYLGGLGMYFLATRWSGSRLGGALAGTVFAFNGLSLNFLMWPSHIATFALMPWVIYLTQQAWETGGRKIILAGLVAAFQVLAGGPETILLTWIVLGLVAVADGLNKLSVQRTASLFLLARRFLAVGFLALLLAAAQLLPFADLSTHSNRSNQFGNAAWSMPAGGWANYLVPLFQTSHWQQIVVQPHQYWTSSYYAGIGTIFLALIAAVRCSSWRVRALGAAAVFSVVLALGDNGFLFVPLQRALPFLGLFRYPVKFVLATTFALPLLAAAGLAAYEKRQRAPANRFRLELACGAALLAMVSAIVWFAGKWPDGNLTWAEVAANGAERASFLIATIVVIYFLVNRREWRPSAGILLVALVWLDVLTHEPWQNPTVDPSLYQRDLAVTHANFNPPVLAGESRVMQSPYSVRETYYKSTGSLVTNYLLDRIVFEANCNLLDQVPKVDGFFSLYLHYSDRVLSLFDSNAEPRLGALEDLMAVSQTIAPGKVFDWVARPGYVPWVSAGQEPVFADEDATLRGLVNTTNDFRKMIFLPAEARNSITAKRQETARVSTKLFTPQKIILTVETPEPAMVSISQAWYHNWKASVDGAVTPVWRANEAFQAVQAPAGRHDITIYYDDSAFRLGGWISIAGLLLCVIGWWRLGRAGEV